MNQDLIVFSRDNLSNTIKNGAYIINLDEYHDIRTHWLALYVNNKIVTYFDSFGVEHIQKEIMKFISRQKIITNIYRIQAYDSIMCGYFCIGFINFMFNGKSLTDYTNLFSPNDFNKNDDIILKYFGLYDVKRIIKINVSIIKDTMLSYCLKCRRNTENINPKVSKTTNGKAMILSTCAICGSKKSKFIRQQEAKGLLSNLGLRTPLNKIPVLGDILF